MINDLGCVKISMPQPALESYNVITVTSDMFDTMLMLPKNNVLDVFDTLSQICDTYRISVLHTRDDDNFLKMFCLIKKRWT